jgi:hypothetical protein
LTVLRRLTSEYDLLFLTFIFFLNHLSCCPSLNISFNISLCISLCLYNSICSGSSGSQDEAPLHHACTLLGVPVEQLKEALISIESIARGEKIRREYKTTQSYDCRDALAKVGPLA